LQAASTLITSLATLKFKDSNVAFEQLESSLTKDEIPVNASTDYAGPETVRYNAIDTLVGTFVALDILSSASTRSQSLFRADYQHWLSDRNIQMHHLIGVDKCIMLLISQISALEEWKRECEANRCLSIKELSNRASSIETALDDFIKRNSLELQAAIPILKMRSPTVIPVPASSKLNSQVVSSVFALSAVTYLHTVVSGAHPGLDEIQKSVLRTMTVLGNLPDPALLCYMVWPFCVTGCLASKEIQGELRELAHSAGASKTGARGLWKSLQVIEASWDGGTRDWAAAMSRIGDKVLLF
jgi:hypothetical protein